MDDEPFICLPKSQSLRQIFDYYCELVEFTPKVLMESDSQDTLVKLIDAGIASGFLPKLTSHTVNSDNIKLIPISYPQCKRYLNLTWKEDAYLSKSPLKTKNSYRNISIGAEAVEILSAKQAKSNSEYVFSSESGGAISPDSVLHKLHRVLDRAGIPRLSFHDLRHSFATLALQNGVDIKTVSSMLGHFSASFTLDTYTHVTTQAQINAASTMGKLVAVSKE